MRMAEQLVRDNDWLIERQVIKLIIEAREEMRKECLKVAWSPIGFEAGSFSASELSQAKIMERIRAIENK